MAIAPITAEDASGLARLLDVLGYPATEQQCRKRIARLRGLPDQAAWGAREPSAGLVGVASGELHRRLHFDEPIAELSALTVLPSSRGQGHGRALVRAFEEWAAANGARLAKVVSGERRDGAHAFYERCGYVRDGFRFRKVIDEGSEPR